MARILIGTSGYSYTEWVGPVYPEGTKADCFLGSYAKLFPSVELNFSYYRMPVPEQLRSMLAQAEGLCFSIKAHESLTHAIKPDAWRSSAVTFRSAAAVLQEADALGAVLLQFPFSFHYDPDRRRYLDSLVRELGDLPLAVEFRNSQWYNNRTLDALRERKVALVSLDLPAIPDSPPMMDVVTSTLAYVRLHGRNRETWWGSDAAARYDYLYSEQELDAIAERVRGLAAAAQLVLVYFNNHRRGQAAKNGRTLTRLLFPGEHCDGS